MNVQRVIEFITHHWLLSAAFVVAFIALIIIEARSKGMGGARLSPSQLTQLVNREQAVILDIRDSVAFGDGHIVNAINIPAADVMQNLKRLEKNKPLVVVCALGQKSAAVMTQLRKQGFEKVYLLAGGIAAWRNANMPIVKG